MNFTKDELKELLQALQNNEGEGMDSDLGTKILIPKIKSMLKELE
jgi:hypothetical protein